MSLYYDAVGVLSSEDKSGSLKSRIYGLNTAKSKPAQIYALIIETSKYDRFLSEVVDQAQLLKDEPKLTPLLSLLLCHDHFFSKKGIAAPTKHPLRQSIEAHKARLQSEFTRARLKRKCATLEALKIKLASEKGGPSTQHPRWVRINTIKPIEPQTLLPTARTVDSVSEVLRSPELSWCEDSNLPNLLACSLNAEVTKSSAYRNGSIILQDKASCFPAHLLFGNQERHEIGDVMDGCAAPGNKTTHAAAILAGLGCTGTLYACERDAMRSKTLQNMTAKAGASQVKVLYRQDFLALKPDESRFSNVTHLLLDPSCSGSGILRREDMPNFTLPIDLKPAVKSMKAAEVNVHGKKRKREEKDVQHEEKSSSSFEDVEVGEEEEVLQHTTAARLEKLCNLQTRIVEHAMKFPAARRITYSTCSIHEQENEVVVTRLLKSDIAKTRGWKVVPRRHQVEGMQVWPNRGVKATDNNVNQENQLNDEELEACIRCHPDDEQGTMGFFVCLFERDTEKQQTVQEDNANDRWEGFD